MPPGSAAERRKSLAIRVTRQDGESAGGRMTATHCSRFRGPEWRPRRPRQAGHSTVVLGSQNKKPMSWIKAGQSAGWQSLCPQHRQQFSTRKHTVNKKTFLAHGKGNYLLSLCTHFLKKEDREGNRFVTGGWEEVPWLHVDYVKFKTAYQLSKSRLRRRNWNLREWLGLEIKTWDKTDKAHRKASRRGHHSCETNR